MGTTTLNRRNDNQTPVLENEVITDLQTVADTTTEQPQVTEAPFVKPEKGKKPTALILTALGVGAIAAGTFGYHYWEYSTTHQETDNAIVAGHIHQVSTKIPGTVTQVLVNDNQIVQPGQLLVKLDPRDYQSKVLQAAAALQNARRQAQAAEANIALTSQTTSGKTNQAQGDVSGAVAAISTAQAAVAEAQAGIPAAQADVRLAAAGIPAAQAQVAQANANLQKAQTDYNRYNSLYQQGAIARHCWIVLKRLMM